MRKSFARFAVVGALVIAGSIGASPAKATGGTFWLFSGSNQTGEARSFEIQPDRLVEFASVFYNQRCSGACDKLDNNVRSIEFSCGSAGGNIDDSDWVQFWSDTGANGSHQLIDPSYPSECSNGLIKRNVTLASPSSMIVNE